MTGYEKRTPESIRLHVRQQIANHTGRKTKDIKLTAKLPSQLDGDGIFDVADAIETIFNIDIPESQVEDWETVADVIDSVTHAKARVRTLQRTRKRPGVQAKTPDATVLKLDTLANDIADRAAESIKSGRNWTFSYCDNELQMRDPKTDDIYAVVTIVVDAMQIGFRVVHFPQPDQMTWDISVPFASWSLGNPYMICQRFDMAGKLYVKDRPEALYEWLVETVANRVQFIASVAPLFKKLIGKPKANGPFIVSEIGMAMDIEIEDTVFDVYTNPDKMEKGDAEALHESLDTFFTQEWQSDDHAPARAKKCKPAKIEPSETPGDSENSFTIIEPKTIPNDIVTEEERKDFRFYDLLRTVPTEFIADLFAHMYDHRKYLELINDNLPVSQTRNTMIDTLVSDWHMNDLADSAAESPKTKVQQIGAMLKANV